MALIECFECKQRISSTAPACIHCGAPAGSAQAAAPKETLQSAPLSFGRLPTNESVPRVTPAAFRRRRTVETEPELGSAIAAPMPTGPRPVELWLKIMVFLLPPFFVWFLLRPGHSSMQRLIGFGWLGLMIALSKA
ncbi:hypothetical protein [Pseudomonas sp. PD9R]|uniref:hypothetical protein n=1 Tax=Pseudomonas sp. PD9R TaxID=2853534 RepID=UPI001C44B6E5|nr:hypothetical protein [Pseudomonas sp. PD9R]MBV6825079.1 hypothetical protein [Pseudomonas sp. PD9R]